MSRSGVSPLDDQWTHVVSGLLVVFGVSAIAVGELLGPPAAAVDGLLADVLDVEAVHHLGVVLVDLQVHLPFGVATTAEVPAQKVCSYSRGHCNRNRDDQVIFRDAESGHERGFG